MYRGMRETMARGFRRHACWQLAVQPASLARSFVRGHLGKTIHFRGLLVASPCGLAIALIWSQSQHRQHAKCEVHVVDSVDVARGTAGSKVTRPKSRFRRHSKWRVFWRCVALLLRLTPLLCAAPVCWLLWQHGGANWFWRSFVSVLQSHGPLTIKLAQWASTRPDLLPPEVCSQLAHLQDDVRPHSFHQTKLLLNAAFGSGWTEKLELEPIPIGSGCMAQVYRGQLREAPDKPPQDVAVKVRHPGAKQSVDLDLEVLWAMVGTLESLWPGARYLAMSEALGHFEEFVRPQADLRTEASNLDAFRNKFEYSKTGHGLRVRFPEVKWPMVSESVLVESFEDATSLQSILRSDSNGSIVACPEFPSLQQARERVADLCMDAFLKMLFSDNFIHGDMHPGNILFRFPDRNVNAVGDLGQPEVILIDAGLAVKLPPRDRRNFVELFHAIAINDGMLAGRLMLERSPGDPSLVLDGPGFVSGVERLISSTRGTGITLGGVRLGEVFSDLLGLALSHRVKLETCFVQVATSIIVLEGVGRQLKPTTDIMLLARPLLAEAILQKLW